MAQTKAQIAAANKAAAAKTAAQNAAINQAMANVQKNLAATKTAITTGIVAQQQKQQDLIASQAAQIANALTPEQVQAMIAQAVSAAATSNTATQKAAAQAATGAAVDDLRSQLKTAGLESLVTVLDDAIRNDQTSAQIKDTIRASQAYKDRFSGMAALQAKGQAISEAQYIALESGYTDTLHAYGLDTKVFGTQQELGKYIANQVSAREFEERVNDAATRVKNNSDVTQALSNMYGVDASAATAYLLNPALGMDVIRKQVRASEIGAAATAAKLSLGSTGIEQAAKAEGLTTQIGGEDLNTLKKEFGQAAILAQTQGRLASIEGQAYTSDTAIQAAVVGDQSALLESQKRAQREAARFGGQGSYITRQSTTGLI